MNKTTKLFAIALLLVASTTVVHAMRSDGSFLEPLTREQQEKVAVKFAASRAADAGAAKVGCVHCACTGIRNVATWDKPVQKVAGIGCLQGRPSCVRKNDGSVVRWISLPIMYAIYTAGIATVYAVAKKIAKKLKNKEAKAVALDVEKVA